MWDGPWRLAAAFVFLITTGLKRFPQGRSCQMRFNVSHFSFNSLCSETSRALSTTSQPEILPPTGSIPTLRRISRDELNVEVTQQLG